LFPGSPHPLLYTAQFPDAIRCIFCIGTQISIRVVLNSVSALREARWSVYRWNFCIGLMSLTSNLDARQYRTEPLI
jgi:hypothetical protein